MSASVIASCAAALAALHAATASAAALPTLLATALSILSPENYYFCEIPDEMKPSLKGVGMGAIAPAGDETPLRYEDAAFLYEASLERRHAFSNPIDERYYKPEITSKLTLLAMGDPLNSDGWLTDRPIVVAGAAVFTNSVIETLFGTNDVYETFYTNVWYSGKSGEFVLDAGVISRLYANIGKMSRRCSSATVYASGGTNNYWEASQYDTDRTDAQPTNYVSRFSTTNFNFSVSDSGTYYKEVKLADDPDGGEQPQESASGDSDSEDSSKSCGEWYSDQNVCPGTTAYIHDGAFDMTCWTNIPWVTVKSMRVFGKGSYSWGFLSSQSSPTNGQYYVVDRGGTNGEFVVEIPCEIEDGVATCFMGDGESNDSILSKVAGLFDDPGINSLDRLKTATPNPLAPDRDSGYSSSGAEATFSREMKMSDFYVVYELEFNARAKGDGEE